MILYTHPPPTKRPSLGHRRHSMRLNLKSENMDLTSLTGIRRGSATYLNTWRNRSLTLRMPSPSPVFPPSSSASSLSSTAAHTSSDPVSCSRKAKKACFVHPVVTAVIEPKVYREEKKVRFAVPLTSIPLRSEGEREGLRLPGTPYDNNTGTICDDVQRHYKGLCMCDRGHLEEYAESLDEDMEDAESSDEDAEPVGFQFRGPVFHDDYSEMFPRPLEDVWGEMGYGIAL
ncbi:hypothetical protein P171DRAFT_508616 [Karstenula rhodostoma CBS 690.94]|uniref:Uncharacterized protein n=1 Tax=Karstenula rhodostoma CBS 690.94 TaxID=1392251 RepID=A0A9P4PQN9_9PLEO|nr:hypothetical protein P171DRAFT_508616 [Karstenula rhodostoma CBS 690.94]